MKYRLPIITLAGVAVVLGLVAFAYFQNWVSVCALGVGLAARLAERILIPKKDPKLETAIENLGHLDEWANLSAGEIGDLKDRLGKLELRMGMRS